MATQQTSPETTDSATSGSTPSGKKKRERSPSYPFLSLREAVACATTLWEHEKRNAVPIPVAASHWGYAAKSSGAFQTIAALKQFGLLTDEGSGEKRHIRLSDSALAILREEHASEQWLSHIKSAALRPAIHRELWNRFKTEASDKNIQTYLVFDRHFAESGAQALIKEYRDTIQFAQLSESDTISTSPEQTNGDGGEITMVQTAELPPKPATGGQLASVREFAVPLPSGAIAAFKIPFPMSEEDFQQYSSLLEAFKTAIVKKAEGQ